MGGAIAQLVAIRHPHRVRSLTLACTAARNHAWRRELLAGWAETAQRQGMGAMTAEAARWTIGPRSFRRISPAVGWLGPLGAVASTARVRRSGGRDPRDRRRPQRASRPHHRAGDGDRRQPGHPHASRRQRGARRADPHRRAGGDRRGRARVHGRARVDVQPDPARLPRPRRGCPSSRAGERRRRHRTGRRRPSVAAAGGPADARHAGRRHRCRRRRAGRRPRAGEASTTCWCSTRAGRSAGGWPRGASATRCSITAPSSSRCAVERSVPRPTTGSSVASPACGATGSTSWPMATRGTSAPPA